MCLLTLCLIHVQTSTVNQNGQSIVCPTHYPETLFGHRIDPTFLIRNTDHQHGLTAHICRYQTTHLFNFLHQGRLKRQTGLLRSKTEFKNQLIQHLVNYLRTNMVIQMVMLGSMVKDVQSGDICSKKITCHTKKAIELLNLKLDLNSNYEDVRFLCEEIN